MRSLPALLMQKCLLVSMKRPTRSLMKLYKLVLVFVVMLSVPADGSSSSTIQSTTKIQGDSEIGRQSENSVVLERESPSKTSQMVVRFYFIRHAETMVNANDLVLGQTDSPLSESGEKQARALGRSDILAKETFWRKYTSDLGRARRTTVLILGEERSLEEHEVRLEPLLRELAKGVREGLPKSMTYEEAQVAFRKEHGPTEPFPPLETEEDAMARVYKWLFQVVRDAIQEARLECSALSSDEGAKRPQQVFSVFAVSHSGTLRATIARLVRDQLPASIDLTPVGRDGAKKGHMIVPNTSVTIVDVIPDNVEDEIWDLERESQIPTNPSFLWKAKLKTLTHTKHYQDV